MAINRTFSIAALCAGLLASQAAGSNVLLLPGENGSAATVNVYSGDPLALVGSFSASQQSFAAVSNAAGLRYYVLSKAATNTLVAADGALNVLQRLDLGSGAAMALSPDGRRLLVLTGQLRVYDATGSNLADITPSPAPNVGSNPIDVAISHDSSRAFILSSASRRLTVLNLNTLAVAGTVSVPGLSTGVVVAPSGLVYVSAQNRIYEIDGAAVTLKGQIAINGLPGRLALTPDGRHALAPNQTPVTGKSVWYFNLENLTEENFFPNFGDTVDNILVVSGTRAFGFSSATGRLFVIPLSPFNMDEATFSNLSGNKFSGVRTITASDELPSAKYLFVATSPASLTRVNLSTNLVQGQVAPSTLAGVSAFAGPAATGTPSSALKYNDDQQVAPGATSRPLVVRALSNTGRPMAGVPLTFTTAAPGAAIQGPMAATNANGFAQALLKAPNTAGNVTVNVNLGGGAVMTSFTVIVGEGGPGAGGLSIVSGQGQVARQSFQSPEPMKVKLVNTTTGNPVANAVVTFLVKTGGGTLIIDPLYTSGGGPASGTQVKVKTNADGLASVNFIASGQLGSLSYDQSTITATSGAAQVSFVVTTVLNLLPGGAFAPDPTVTMLTPPSTNRRINGKVGQTIPAAIRVGVVVTAGLQSGQGIPNVGVTASTGLDPEDGPTAGCASGTALTDATGIATCDLVVGPKIGTATLAVIVGSFNTQPSIALNVAPGDPAQIEIQQGNDQVGRPGQQLRALVARITDAGGNPLPGVTAQWEVVTPGTATLSNTTSVANTQAQVSTVVTLGNIAGTVQIRVRSGAAVATFTLTVTIPITGLRKISGDGQTAEVNMAFGQPLVVKAVDAQENGVAGIPVAFVVSSGSATLNPTSATTDANGLASTMVTAGAVEGPISIGASSGDFAATFSLTVVPHGPVVTLAGVVNAISGNPGVTPGGVIAIYGANLAPGINGSVVGWNVVGPLPLELADVEVTFGAIPAPIYSVNNINGQQWVVVQAPFELTAPGTVSVTIKVGGGSTTVNGVPVKPYQPGIFEALGPGGERYGLVLKEDGSFVSPASPAPRGSRLRVFIAGVGQTNPATGTNFVGIPGQKLLAKLVVGVNNAGVHVESVETMVGVIGVYIATFDLPANTAAGPDRPFAIAIIPADGSRAIFGNPSTIAVQ